MCDKVMTSFYIDKNDWKEFQKLRIDLGKESITSYINELIRKELKENGKIE